MSLTSEDPHNMAKDSVAVRIAGHEYKIRSDGDPGALREIAGYVDRAMTRVRDRTGTVDSLDVAVLTCLNLAREILALHEERAPAGSTAVDTGELRALIERVEGTLDAVRSKANTTREKSVEGGTEQPRLESSPDTPPSARPVSRTLELPSVESMRERATGPGGVDGVTGSAGVSMPEARAAAGGRDRVS